MWARIRPRKKKRTPKRTFQPTPTNLRFLFCEALWIRSRFKTVVLTFLHGRGRRPPALAGLLFKAQHHARTLSNYKPAPTPSITTNLTEERRTDLLRETFLRENKKQ